MSDRIYWAASASCPELTPSDVASCLHFFSSGAEMWHASHDQLRCAGVSNAHALAFVSFRPSFDVTALDDTVQKNDISIILVSDSAYPSLLMEIFDPPAVLFVRGTLRSPIPHPLAVVGSRNITPYGKQVIDRIISPTAQAGCSIISGLAYGCDAAAHEAALSHGAYTIAVLGTGADDASIYPHRHLALAHRILEQGGVIMSEFAPGTPGLKHHFPRRNRIISGMSHVVCIVEAADKSGSLVTARSALDQNRTVCSVPGSVFSPQSVGCNNLIAAGARPILCAQDILDEFGLSIETPSHSYTPANEQESVLLSLLSDVPTHIDDLIAQSQLSASTIMTSLTIMESKRIVKHISGMSYVKRL